MESTVLEAVSCLCLGVCKVKHTRAKEFCPIKGKWLQVTLPELQWRHKPVSRSALISLGGHGATLLGLRVSEGHAWAGCALQVCIPQTGPGS